MKDETLVNVALKDGTCQTGDCLADHTLVQRGGDFVSADGTSPIATNALSRHFADQQEVPPNLIDKECISITPQMLTLVQLTSEQINRIVQSVCGGVANVQDIYPLSPLQEGMLFHHLLNQRSDSYVLSTLFELQGRTQADELIAALQFVVDRHDILRTAVLWEGLPRPVQVVYRRAALFVEELAVDPGRDPLERLKGRMRPQGQAFDLRQAPLMCLTITPDARGRVWYGLLQIHHVISDHQSLGVLVAEAMECMRGRELTLAPPIPYRNYVAHVLSHVRTTEAEVFFRAKLGDVDHPTLPFGLGDVHGDGSEIDEDQMVLDPITAEHLRLQARRCNISAARLFHAAWGLVVANTSGSHDVVYGTVLLTRQQRVANAQRMLGMAVNTLPLRLRLKGVTAQQLIEQTNREVSELLKYEATPLTVAQQCSGVGTGAALFSAILNFRRRASEPPPTSVAGIQVLERGEAWTNYPFTMTIDDLGQEFVLIAKADRRVGPRRLLVYLQTALESLIQALAYAPQTIALDLVRLPASERRQVVELFNATRTAYPEEKLLHQLFEEQVKRTPAALAVVCERRSLTFAQLNRKANQLARYLRSKGVGPDLAIAICVERSLEMVVGLLGIWKAGGAYVPLDPNYPTERLAYILEDAAPKVILSQGGLRDIFPRTTAEVISLDEDWELIDEQMADDLDWRVVGLCSRNLAYVIHTSGSTGRPKGVMVEHRNVVSLWQGLENIYRESAPCQRVAVNASLNFDASVKQVIQLLSGRTIVMVPHGARVDTEELVRRIHEDRVEGIDCTPSQLRSWISTGLLERVGHQLRMVLVGGEPITAELWNTLAQHSGAHIYNVYGPTESTVDATCARLNGDMASPHVGRPLQNRCVYILDGCGNPAPIGVIGEICIGGAGVARGYLNRAELTAERFVPDPFGDDPYARLYKTGDLGRWRADGTVEYVGRTDQQVKIRGMRIELGDIESHLSRHELVAQAAVADREDLSSDKRLVAYIVLAHPADATDVQIAETLRKHLRTALPEYMVPSAFVTLDALPLTVNGKLNRRALPQPDLRAYASKQYEAPIGKIEEMLAQMWQEMLQVERVGRHDNFFDIGGHSLLVLKALFIINEHFGSDLRVTDVYRSPTIRELAIRIRGELTEDSLVDLSREAWLGPHIIANAASRRERDEAVLLTGGTGFVGRFLLAQLLHDTEATVFCLVRARSAQQAMSRLKETLSRWGLWCDGFEGRMVAIPGDLRMPRLGIDDLTYQELCRNLDSIYHCATSMNHLETYAMAKPVNVGAVREVLKLATLVRPKLVNYISTLSIFSSMDTDGIRVVDEKTPIDGELHQSLNGYAASKWVGEKILMTASERGIPCNLFRLGLVWADSEQGRYDELQRVYRVIKSCLLSGYGIENHHYDMVPTPVDYVARSVVFLGRRRRDDGGIFHISSRTQAIDGVFERCNAMLGTSLELIPLYDWIGVIRRLHQEGRSLPVVPLIDFAFSMDEATFHEHQRQSRTARIRFDCAYTQHELAQVGITAPVVDNKMLQLCVRDMLSRDTELQDLSERRGDQRAARSGRV